MSIPVSGQDSPQWLVPCRWSRLPFTMKANNAYLLNLATFTPPRLLHFTRERARTKMTDVTYTVTAPANNSTSANTSTPANIQTSTSISSTSIPTSISIPTSTSTPTPTIMTSNHLTEAATAVPQPRLLDLDASKYRSLKQAIVIGRPGSGVDGK